MEEKEAPLFKLGQIVYYRGIVLQVSKLREDGWIEARSPTMHVTATPDEYQTTA